MPGVPQMGPGKLMEERSRAEVVFLFMILPMIAGAGLLWMTVDNAVDQGREFTVADWFWQVGVSGLLGLALLTALPSAGWQELQRRKACMPANDETDRE